MNELFEKVGEVELCYETYGDASAPPVLLIMGLGTQMIGWPADFCEAIAERGFHVIRYDNRDVGRSTRFDHVPPPKPSQLFVRRPTRLAYTLSDMAADAAGLLTELGFDSAHVVGASMGGMIGQVLAIERPERVRSFVSIMSTTGSRFVGQPAAGVYPFFLRPLPRSKEAYLERGLRLWAVIGSPGFPRDEDEIRRRGAAAWERSHDPEGVARQLLAILASPDRTPVLCDVKVPSLVIHGAADPLVNATGGEATAKAIPGAELVMIEGMGHDLPEGAWPQIVDAIDANARKAVAA